MELRLTAFLISTLCLFSTLALAQDFNHGCLYTPDHCASTSWSHRVEGGKILSYIAVSGNVLTLTLKTFKRDSELSKGMLAAATKLNFFCDPAKIHEFDFDHNYVFHPTSSHNHLHYPLFRNLFPLLPLKLAIYSSIYVEKLLNLFRIKHEVVEEILKQVEPELADQERARIVENFREWEQKTQSPQRVFSSVRTPLLIEQSIATGAVSVLATIAGAILVTAVYSLITSMAAERFASLA